MTFFATEAQGHRGPLPGDINQLPEKITGRAIGFHREPAPGILEAAHEEAIGIQLAEVGLRFQRQIAVPTFYRARRLVDYRLDPLIEDAVILEIKSVQRFDPVFQAQTARISSCGWKKARPPHKSQFRDIRRWRKERRSFGQSLALCLFDSVANS